MIDLIDFDEEWMNDIMMNQFEVLVSDPMFDVAFSTGEKIIRDDHFVALEHQPIDQMRTDESKGEKSLHSIFELFLSYPAPPVT